MRATRRLITGAALAGLLAGCAGARGPLPGPADAWHVDLAPDAVGDADESVPAERATPGSGSDLASAVEGIGGVSATGTLLSPAEHAAPFALGASFDIDTVRAGEPSVGSADAPEEDLAESGDLGAISQQMNNPVGPLWLLFNQHDTVWWEGDATSGSVPQHSFKMQPVMPIPIDDDWNLILRPVLPFVSIDTPSARTGRWDRNDGFGDAVLLAALSPANSGAETVWGVGLTQIFDTASNDAYGLEQFATGPGATYFHLGEKWVAGVVAQHWWGYSEPSDKDSLNLTDFQYVLRYRLTPTFQVGMTPNIQVDWEADGGDKYTVPIGLGVDWTTRIGEMPFRFGVEYQHYVHSPDEFGPDWGIRVFLIPVIPNPLIGD